MSGDLAIFSADDVVPYERPPLSKSFLAGKDSKESVLISPPGFYETHGIDIRRNTTITSIDSERKLLQTAAEDFAFEKLVRDRSTGPHARRPWCFAAKRAVSPQTPSGFANAQRKQSALSS